MWRGQKNGGASSSDCSGQCAPGETNIAGTNPFHPEHFSK
jgi:hypothetical protein